MNNHIPLTAEQATQLAGAYARFSELNNTKIRSAKDDAELKGLVEFISSTLVTHASEFIGCWFAIRNEYEPIIGLLSRVAQRVTAINARPLPEVAAQQGSASNIVTLGK